MDYLRCVQARKYGYLKLETWAGVLYATLFVGWKKYIYKSIIKKVQQSPGIQMCLFV